MIFTQFLMLFPMVYNMTGFGNKNFCCEGIWPCCHGDRSGIDTKWVWGKISFIPCYKSLYQIRCF